LGHSNAQKSVMRVTGEFNASTTLLLLNECGVVYESLQRLI